MPVHNLIPEQILSAEPKDPESVLRGKFVVIDRDKTTIMVIGLLPEFPYHANLVARYCSDQDIGYDWVRFPDLVEIGLPRARVLGGGYFEIDSCQQLVKLSGRSTAYGSCTAIDIQSALESDPFLADFTFLSPQE